MWPFSRKKKAGLQVPKNQNPLPVPKRATYGGYLGSVSRNTSESKRDDSADMFLLGMIAGQTHGDSHHAPHTHSSGHSYSEGHDFSGGGGSFDGGGSSGSWDSGSSDSGSSYDSGSSDSSSYSSGD